MKKMTIDSSRTALLEEVLSNARKDRVLLKRGGRPIALVINVEGKDEEQLDLENDPQFWRKILKARREPTVPYSLIKEQLLADERTAIQPKTKISKTRRKV